MAQIPVKKETLANKRLKPLNGYGFLAKFPICEVVVGELSVAATNWPIFFIEREGRYAAVAILSLLEGECVFVEADGRWSGNYLPAAFRRYPFSVVEGIVDGKPGPVLMVEEDALSDSEGEMLFAAEEKDEPNSPLGRVLRLIAETDRSNSATRALVAELSDADLIRPADLTVELEPGQKHSIGGLFGIDEQKLQDLPDDKFLKLRHSGALTIAHVQLQSVGQVQRLIMRHRAREEAKRSGTPPKPPVD